MKVSSQNTLGWIDVELKSLEQNALRREPWAHAARQGPTLVVDGCELINFGSNDYLSLAADPAILEAAAGAIQEYGWGAGASPLVTGRTEAHRQLEVDLAELEGTEAALIFSSGFAANVGAITALVGQGDAIYGDQKNHASIIDGCRLSRADVHIYRHRDCDHLASLLEAAGGFRRRLIVTDSLFSMDGDFAPLEQIAALAERYDAMLLVDEAHATGVLGDRGRGVSELLGVEDRIDVRVGTLSKALGSSGGFVSGSRPLIQWLYNRARPYVFSTATVPAAAAAASAAVKIVRDEPRRRTQLLERAAWLRAKLNDQGWNTAGSPSHIIPVVIGDARQTMQLAARLRTEGLLVPGIRPPSVPDGESLLRLSVCYGHTPAMLERLAGALGTCQR